MTTIEDPRSVSPPAPGPSPSLASDPLSRCLEAALAAADAGDVLGLDSHPLREAHAAGVRRIGYPGNAYVVALIGGTGVGKSSLLNALADGVVSTASARRPTTSEPIAWVPREERAALQPLLEWLDVRETREHDADGLASVAILDLPDMDSVATEHRERVESLLPLVDAVAWVTDPEKYADAVLHDDFLRTWLPRLGRQVVLVNKSDRLDAVDGRRLRRDLEADLASGAIGGSEVAVLPASAIAPGGATGLRAWLSAGSESKQIIRGRIAASLAATARDLGWAAGDGRGTVGRPFLDEAARDTALRAATEAVLRMVDVRGLERQFVAATQANARMRGTGPLGRLTSLLYRASGRQTAVADPNRFLLRWRERTGMAAAVEALREALAAPIRDAPPAIRPAIAGAVDTAEVRSGLERSVERAVRDVGTVEPPTSRLWPLLGFLQTVVSAGIALSAAWVVVWILVRPETGSVVLPLLGPVPTPFVALVTFVILGYLLARLVGAHARWIGSRAAAGIRSRISSSVEREVRQGAFRRLDELEDARARLAAAVEDIDGSCGPQRFSSVR
jgi:50S ribosome-binding GTPase